MEIDKDSPFLAIFNDKLYDCVRDQQGKKTGTLSSKEKRVETVRINFQPNH